MGCTIVAPDQFPRVHGFGYNTFRFADLALCFIRRAICNVRLTVNLRNVTAGPNQCMGIALILPKNFTVVIQRFGVNISRTAIDACIGRITRSLMPLL